MEYETETYGRLEAVKQARKDARNIAGIPAAKTVDIEGATFRVPKVFVAENGTRLRGFKPNALDCLLNEEE